MADGGDGRGHDGGEGGHDHGDGHVCNCAQEHLDSLEGIDERSFLALPCVTSQQFKKNGEAGV